MDVLRLVRTGAFMGGCFPESLWTLRQTAGRGVDAVREDTYARQLLLTERRMVRLRRAVARLKETKARMECEE